jgi:single-stranded-DNA-specific exonuclease
VAHHVAGAAHLTAANVRDRRGSGIAGLLADLVAAGEPVLAIVAHAPHRARTLRGRIGGFAVCSWAALEDDPELAAAFAHLVAVDPPCDPRMLTLLERASGAARGHLAWGEPELRFAQRIHQWDFALREPLTRLYRALRGAGEVRGEALEAVLRGGGSQPRSAALAGRLVRVLVELDLAVLDREGQALRLTEAPERTALERSPAFRAYHRRLEDGLRFLTSDTIPQAA